MSIAVEAALAGREIIWGAPVYDQVRICWEETKRAAGGVARFRESVMICEFPTGGRIIYRSMDDPDKARGYTADGVVIDEAADVAESAWYEVLRAMLIDTGGWSWAIGCVRGDTLLTTADGIVPISSISEERHAGAFVGYNKAVAGFSEGHQLASHFYANGMAETIRITTRAGYQLEATLNHPVWAMGADGVPQWIELQNLRHGQYVAIRRGADLWGNSDEECAGAGFPMTPDLAYLMGLVVGDGHVDYLKSYRTTIACSPDEEETRAFLVGQQFRPYRMYHLRRNCKAFTDFLQWYGFLPGVKANRKELPARLLRASRETCAAFLSGLFDADGTAHKKRGRISFTTTSVNLARQVQALLLNFGIVTRWREHVVDPTLKVIASSYSYTLELSPKDSRLFYERIGFRLTRKQSRVECLGDTAGPRAWKNDGVPLQQERLQRVRKGAWFQGNVTYNLDMAPKQQMVGYPKLREFLDRCQETEARADWQALHELCQAGYFWDDVVEIGRSCAETFDLCVPTNHAFVGNGFINHNTPKGQNWFWREFVSAQDRPDSMAWSAPTFGVEITEQGLVRRPHPLENPTIPFEEMLQLYRTLPERTFRQEILAEFQADSGSVFRNVRQAIDPGRAAAEDPLPGRDYYLGVDLARVEDFTVLSVLEEQHRQVYFERFNQISWERQIERIAAVAERYNGAVVMLDSTGVGDPIFEALRNRKLNVEGFKFTNESKERLIDSLAMGIEGGTVRLLDIPTQTNELLGYQYELTPSRNVRMAAPEGMHDDTVVALALADWCVSHPGGWWKSKPFMAGLAKRGGSR